MTPPVFTSLLRPSMELNGYTRHCLNALNRKPALPESHIPGEMSGTQSLRRGFSDCSVESCLDFSLVSVPIELSEVDVRLSCVSCCIFT
jgi:hypothetical protein